MEVMGLKLRETGRESGGQTRSGAMHSRYAADTHSANLERLSARPAPMPYHKGEPLGTRMESPTRKDIRQPLLETAAKQLHMLGIKVNQRLL